VIALATHLMPDCTSTCKRNCVTQQNIPKTSKRTLIYEVYLKQAQQGGFKGEGANWAVAQGPPQLRGLHKKYRYT